MKKSVLNANALTVVDNQEVLLENGSFSVYEGEFLAFCQTSQSRFFFPELLKTPSVEYRGILDYKGQPVSKKNPIRTMYISGPDMLIESMSIVDNLFVIRKHYRISFLYNERKAKAVLKDMLSQIGLPFDIRLSVSDLSVSEKYILLLAKAIIMEVPIIVLGNLTQYCMVSYYPWIYDLIQRYRQKGRTFVLLSNDNHDLVRQCDRIYFCRGKYIVDLLFQDEYSDQIFQDILFGYLRRTMIRKETSADYHKVRMRVDLPEEWYTEKRLEIYRGEIFGILDLHGTLTSQIYQLFFDKFPYWIDGEVCRSYREAICKGLAAVSLHRGNIKFEGLSEEENLLFLKMRQLRKNIIINRRIEAYCINQYADGLSDRNPQDEWSMGQLKHLIYRWLMTNPKVMVIDNPPLNLDGEQWMEFIKLMQEIVDTGCSIILLCTAVRACTDLCDRILTIYEHGENEIIRLKTHPPDILPE